MPHREWKRIKKLEQCKYLFLGSGLGLSLVILIMLMNYGLDLSSQTENLLENIKQEKLINTQNEQVLKKLQKAELSWAQEAGELDLLLTISNENTDWLKFFEHLPLELPKSLTLSSFKLNKEAYVELEGIFNLNNEKDLKIFLENLKQEGLFNSVEIQEAQGNQFIILAQKERA